MSINKNIFLKDDYIREGFIRVKEIVDENFQDYKKSAMMIATVKCDFKCFTELGISPTICQNMEVSKKANIEMEIKTIFKRYISNPITHAVVIGGLEPMLQFDEIFSLIKYFRDNKCEDDFVIYTGYCKEEIEEEVNILKNLGNIVIKYGRFIPESNKRFDEVLEIYLSSDNQYAEKIC